MINIKGLMFKYPGQEPVFDNFNFSYKENQKIGIVGPNGSGKTTLLNILMGLLKPNEGQIEIFGKQRKNEKDFIEVRKKIGYLFQNSDHQLFCPTVTEDIAFGPLNMGKTHKETKDIVEKMLNLFGLEEYKNRASYRLSWGEKRIISLAAVLAAEPDLLLLDELTSGLDESSRNKVMDYLSNNCKSFIISSHDIEFLKAFSAEIYDIKK